MSDKKHLDEVELARKDAVRIALIRHGLNLKKLATACGISREYFSDKFNKAKLSEELRAKVEAVFDYQEPIWASPRELTLRKSCRSRTGTDPATLKKPALLQYSRGLGVVFSTEDTKAQVLAKTLDFIAANPSRPLNITHEKTVGSSE